MPDHRSTNREDGRGSWNEKGSRDNPQYRHFEVSGRGLQAYFACEQHTTHQYLLCLKVPKKQDWNTRRGRAGLKKSQLSSYLLTATIKHINESCIPLSSSSLCGHSPKRRQCDEPEESKAKLRCFKISLTGKLISALRLSFLKPKQEKRRKEILLQCQNFYFSSLMVPLNIFNGCSSTWNLQEQGLGSQNSLECLHPHFRNQSTSTENKILIEKLKKLSPPYILETY